MPNFFKIIPTKVKAMSKIKVILICTPQYSQQFTP